jgi:hypothetical protein
MLQLFLNDTLVDLTDDSPIALTFQINNLAEVKNQQGNTSNQFKLPLTQRNRQILGFPDEVAFTDCKPYQQYSAKIVQDGLEIIPTGVAELNSIDDSTASITVLSGNVDFFDAIDGGIYDMGDSTTTWGKSQPWASHNHDWNLGNVVTSQTKTEGWIWPVIDYGNLAYASGQSATIDISYLRPGFFLKTAVEIIAKNIGFKATGSLLKNDLYNKLIVQFANDEFEHGTDYINSYQGLSIKANANSQQQLIYGAPYPRNVRFANVAVFKPEIYNTTRSEYIAKANVEVEISVEYKLSYIASRSDGRVEIHIRLYDTNGGETNLITNTHTSNKILPNQSGFSRLYGETFETKRLTVTKALTPGQRIAISYDNDRSSTTGIMLPDAVFIVSEKKTNVLLGQQVQTERIFPDLNQKDLLKDIFQRFGIICQTDSEKRIINFATLKDIIDNIPRAKDWTSKCLAQGKSITFKLGSYSQINYLKHKEDDGITPKTFGQAQINIDDKTLPATSTLFESQFAPTFNRSFLNGSIALIKKTETGNSGENDFSVSTQPRLLVDQKFDLRRANSSVTFKDDKNNRQVVNDTISVPYFYKPDGDYNLCWSDMPGTGFQTQKGLKNTYYPELEKILYQSKKVVRWFLLTPRDILELDLLIPVYLQQDGAYYYINKIDSWRKGQATKVELVKLG